MGPLPGWWLGEADGRRGGPLLDVPEWHAGLLRAGFSGVDMDVRGDREDSKKPVSLIVSTKPRTAPAAAPIKALAEAIVVHTGTPASINRRPACGRGHDSQHASLGRCEPRRR